MKIYISASWKNRLLVCKLTGILRVNNHKVLQTKAVEKHMRRSQKCFPNNLTPRSILTANILTEKNGELLSMKTGKS